MRLACIVYFTTILIRVTRRRINPEECFGEVAKTLYVGLYAGVICLILFFVSMSWREPHTEVFRWLFVTTLLSIPYWIQLIYCT